MRFPHFLVIVCTLTALLSSCEQPSEQTTSSTASEQTENKPNSQLTDNNKSLKSSEDEFLNDINSGTSDGKEAKPLNQPESIENIISNTSSSSSSKSMIENLGFSSATQTFSKPSDSSTAPICLELNMATIEALSSKEIIESACKKISDRLASVDYQNCLSAELKASGCKSVKDFPILIREFAPLNSRKPLGRILVIGGTHGDELTSVSVTMRWIDQLRKNHSGLFYWHIAPLMNPDAVLKPSATRTNHNGVDLNRNMPSLDWDEKALKYWRQKSSEDVRKFPGNKPASEPETQWLIDEINHFKPDAIISVHAPYGVVDFDSLLLNAAPKSLGKLHLNLLGTYPGSLGNYAGINRNIPVITLELPHSWEMPSLQESDQIWQDIVLWLKDNVPTEGS